MRSPGFYPQHSVPPNMDGSQLENRKQEAENLLTMIQRIRQNIMMFVEGSAHGWRDANEGNVSTIFCVVMISREEAEGVRQRCF